MPGAGQHRPPPPFSQAVRSGLLRMTSAWSPVRGAKRNGAPQERGAAPSEASQSGPPGPVRFWRADARSCGLRLRRPYLRPRCGLRLLGESFRAVKVKILRLQSGYAVHPRAQRQIGLRKRAPAFHASGTQEGLQGSFACFSPGKPFDSLTLGASPHAVGVSIFARHGYRAALRRRQ